MVGGNPTKPSCSFYPCLHPAACLGKANDVYEGRYLESRDFFNERELAINETSSDDKAVVDLARYPHWDEACDEDRGYANNCTNSDNQPSRCRLCGTCKPGYKRHGGGTKCKVCPPPAANRALLAVGVVVMFVGSAVLVYVTIQSSHAHDDDVADGIKKIALNFLQVTSLAAGLPLRWPPVMETMFEIFKTVSSAGSNLLIPDCELSHMKTADVYFLKQVAFVFLVPLIACTCVVAWAMIYKCSGALSRAKQVKKSDAKDFAILSAVLMTFLAYPMLTRSIFSMFKCPRIGDKTFLVADLQEACFEGRHLHYFLGLTLPQILLYIIGLPVAALVLLRRNKERIINQDMSFHMRYGFLFFGYRLEWWESVTASRKVVVVLIGTLGTLLNSVNMQAFLAILVIFVSIFIHLTCEPFDVDEDSGRLLHRLELGALTMNFLTFWGGYVYSVGGFFICDDAVLIFLGLWGDTVRFYSPALSRFHL